MRLIWYLWWTFHFISLTSIIMCKSFTISSLDQWQGRPYSYSLSGEGWVSNNARRWLRLNIFVTDILNYFFFHVTGIKYYPVSSFWWCSSIWLVVKQSTLILILVFRNHFHFPFTGTADIQRLCNHQQSRNVAFLRTLLLYVVSLPVVFHYERWIEARTSA